MSASTIPPSDLSSPSYGYDFVVAVTQDSINATMLEYLSNLSNNPSPAIELFWTADPTTGNAVLVTNNTAFLQSVQDIDPFSVPAGTVYADARVQTLFSARFMFGVRVKIGLPHVPNPSTLKNIVTFGNNAITGVTFNLYCSTFDIVQLTPGGGWVSTGSWLNISQDPSNPWIYSASVNLQFQSQTFANLPQDVQKKIQSTGANAFSVQQLLFDLANAGLESSPTLSSAMPQGSQVATSLNADFCGVYFSQMQAAGQPVFGYTVTGSGQASSSTLQASSINLMVDTYMDPTQNNKLLYGSGLTTLNYLCSVASTQPPATAFTWNWVPDAVAQADHDGVVSINRSWFVNYFSGKLLGYIEGNCYAPSVRVTYSDLKVYYTWSVSPGNSPTITKPATGTTILQYSYSADSSDQAGLNGAEGKMNLSTNFTLNVEFVGTNSIVITQHLIIYTSISLELSTGSGNIVDKMIVDTYTIAVDANGNLLAPLSSSQTTDNSKWSKANSFLNFFDDVNSIVAQAQEWANGVIGTSFMDIPISNIQGFIFPGGNTFTYKGVGFSPYQDLVSLITYTTPSSS